MTDILLNNEGDLNVNNNDFVIGESTKQHQTLLLETTKGSWKENPSAGVGVIDFLESESPELLMQEIRKQYSGDGMNVKSIGVKNGKLIIDASY